MEIELKLSLTAADAQRLRAHLGAPLRVVLQLNQYFDDPTGSLDRAGWGLRLRRESSPPESGAPTYVLTVKQSGEQVGDFSHRPEFERAITRDEYRAWRARPAELGAAAARLTQAPELARVTDLRQLGAMENTREVYPLEGAPGAEVELDQTRWPDGSVSFELEVEVPAAGDQERVAGALRRVLDALQIAWTPSTSSKLGRLVALLRAG